MEIYEILKPYLYKDLINIIVEYAYIKCEKNHLCDFLCDFLDYFEETFWLSRWKCDICKKYIIITEKYYELQN